MSYDTLIISLMLVGPLAVLAMCLWLAVARARLWRRVRPSIEHERLRTTTRRER